MNKLISTEGIRSVRTWRHVDFQLLASYTVLENAVSKSMALRTLAFPKHKYLSHKGQPSSRAVALPCWTSSHVWSVVVDCAYQLTNFRNKEQTDDF